MNYVLDYVVNHLGNRHSGTVVLRREGPPKAGDDLEVRIAGFSTPILIDSVDPGKRYTVSSMQDSSAPLTRSRSLRGLGWPVSPFCL